MASTQQVLLNLFWIWAGSQFCCVMVYCMQGSGLYTGLIILNKEVVGFTKWQGWIITIVLVNFNSTGTWLFFMHANTSLLHSLTQHFFSFFFFVHLGMKSLSLTTIIMYCLHGWHTGALEEISNATTVRMPPHNKIHNTR